MELAKELKASGFLIWFDQLDIPTGSRWDDEIEKALTQCEIFMVILTPQSIASNNVKDEIGYALDSNKRILPILLEHADVPFRIRRFQYVDFTDKSNNEGIMAAKQLLRKLMDEPTIPRPQSVATNVQSPQPEIDRSVELKAQANRLARQKAEAIRKAREQEQRERISQAASRAPSPEQKAPQQQTKKQGQATRKLIPIIIGISLLLLLCLGGGWVGWVAWSTNTDPPSIPTTKVPAVPPVTDTPTFTPSPAVPPTDTPTFTPSPAIPPISSDPVQFVVDYWNDVSVGDYDKAWKSLSPDFQNRFHNNDINNYKSSFEARNYCRIETSNRSLITNDGSTAIVSIQVIYYVGQSCTPAAHNFEITLIYNNVDQMWQYEKTVEIE